MTASVQVGSNSKLADSPDVSTPEKLTPAPETTLVVTEAGTGTSPNLACVPFAGFCCSHRGLLPTSNPEASVAEGTVGLPRPCAPESAPKKLFEMGLVVQAVETPDVVVRCGEHVLRAWVSSGVAEELLHGALGSCSGVDGAWGDAAVVRIVGWNSCCCLPLYALVIGK